MASHALETFRTWVVERGDLTPTQRTDIFARVGQMMHGAYHESNALQEGKLRQHVTAHRNDNIGNADAVAVADTMLEILDLIREGEQDLATHLGAAIDDVAGI